MKIVAMLFIVGCSGMGIISNQKLTIQDAITTDSTKAGDSTTKAPLKVVLETFNESKKAEASTTKSPLNAAFETSNEPKKDEDSTTNATSKTIFQIASQPITK